LTSAGVTFAAVDLGADSGRVVARAPRRAGRCRSRSSTASPTARPLPDGLHWNLLELFSDTLEGFAQALRSARWTASGSTPGAATTACSTAPRSLLGLPFHYRDERTRGMIATRPGARRAGQELYAVTGIQTMPINTIFQLLVGGRRGRGRVAERIALVPDLFGLWLTGTLANEITAASTTGLLDARSGAWARP
jgi:rhamnulokinase